MIDTLTKLDEARAILIENPKDDRATLLVKEAFRALAEEGRLPALAVRNQVLRLGSLSLFDDYLTLTRKVDWQHIDNLLQEDTFDRIFNAGDPAYLDRLFSAGIPPRSLFEAAMARASKAPSGPLVDWIATRAARHISPIYATSILLDLALDCDRHTAGLLAPNLCSQVPLLGPEVRFIFFDLVGYRCLKAPVILLLCGLKPALFQAGLQEHAGRGDTSPPYFEAVARLGASHHGRLLAHQMEPDLPGLLSRHRKESFLGMRE